MSRTLDYYNANADKFIAGTVSVDFKQVRDKFLGYLPEHALILDLGCGSGRDTKCFMEQGYPVDAVDGSEELCKAATEYTGIEVKQMLFQDLDVADKYDGIWACASILHLSKAEIPDVITKMVRSLKSNGVIYTSFKYGNWGFYYPESIHEDQWAYEMFPDGEIKYYAYPMNSRRVLDKDKVQIEEKRVMRFYESLLDAFKPWNMTEECRVCDGCSYQLDITYSDGRKRKHTGDLGGGTIDKLVMDFLGSIPEMKEKI